MMPDEVYYLALRIRMIEEMIAKEYSKQEMRCPIHLSIGQELNATILCHYLDDNDMMVSGHRAHAHYLAKGGNLKSLIAELHGKETGCSSGFGGSMHLVDRTVGFMGSTAIVAGSIPIGVGLAFAKKIKKEKGIVVICFGDGALEEGVTHEAMNFASLHKLPVLFFCENNQYSCYTHIDKRQPAHDFKYLALAHDLGYENDISYILRTVDSVRNCVPTLMVIDSWRELEHCGSNNDDHLGYRKKKKEEDKLVRWLEARTEVARSEVEGVAKEIKKEVAAAFTFARKSSFPKEVLLPLAKWAR